MGYGFDVSPIQSAKSYTCLTCRVVFKDCQKYREHYTTEWHKYNLHRKMVGYPIVTLEEFQERSANYRKTDKDKTKETFNCKLCRKKYNSEKQYNNHLTSIKHKKNMEKDAANSSSDSTEELTEMKIATKSEKDKDSDADSMSSSAMCEILFPSYSYDYCLFCDKRSDTLFHNLYHMKKKHSFFIPDEEYCFSLRRLLNYLAVKIWIHHKCLWCNDSGRQMRSAEAVRSHMIDKGHCKLLYEEETRHEYRKFYNYSTSYPDYPASDVDLDEELSEPEVLLDDGYELTLPSGKKIGHRTLMRYYKQYLKPEIEADSETNTRADFESVKNQPKDNVSKLRSMVIRYNSLGSKEALMTANRKKWRDIQHLQKIHAKYSTQLQLKQNKLQKQFRPQINF